MIAFDDIADVEGCSGFSFSAARELGVQGLSGKKRSPESPDSETLSWSDRFPSARINVVRFKGFDLSPKAPPAIPNSYVVVPRGYTALPCAAMKVRQACAATP